VIHSSGGRKHTVLIHHCQSPGGFLHGWAVDGDPVLPLDSEPEETYRRQEIGRSGFSPLTLDSALHCSYGECHEPAQIEWDAKKNAANRRKRGIAFEEAKIAFLDDNARVIPDPEHSENEKRFVGLMLSHP
jgi:hypothetical protein